MKRRQFVATAVAAVGATSGLAGCLGGSSSPPPRRSDVVSEMETTGGELVVELVSDPEVQSRADLGSSSLQPLVALLPVGRAAAAKGGGGGRGAAGRGSGGWSSAPHRGGHAIYGGGDYADDWRENHRDELSMYDAAVGTVGVARIGSTFDDEDELPGVQPVPWDRQYDASAGEQVTYDIPREGWYRVGIELDAEQYSHDFDWAFFDFRVEEEVGSGYEMDEPWKLSPRL